MIRIERDPAWWAAVAASLSDSHLAPSASDLAAVCALANVLPLASERGGFFFIRLDAGGFVCELHTLYRPQAWASREITTAAKEAFNAVFLADYQAVTTLEVRANPRSQPPRSYGFVQAGDWRGSVAGEVRAWVLTRAAWEASPANRRARSRLN